MKMSEHMTIRDWVEIAGFVTIAAPVYWGALRRIFLDREYPPHKHIVNGDIEYPRGYEPGTVVRFGGLGR
jgi:hypothetical protein